MKKNNPWYRAATSDTKVLKNMVWELEGAKFRQLLNYHVDRNRKAGDGENARMRYDNEVIEKVSMDGTRKGAWMALYVEGGDYKAGVEEALDARLGMWHGYKLEVGRWILCEKRVDAAKRLFKELGHQPTSFEIDNAAAAAKKIGRTQWESNIKAIRRQTTQGQKEGQNRTFGPTG